MNTYKIIDIAKNLYLKIGIIIVATFLISSCTTQEKLPASWGIPLLTHGNICPNISGRYMNLGQQINDTKYPPRLFNVLFTDEEMDKNLSQLSHITHISIEQADDNLVRLTAWKGREMVYSKSLLRESGGFMCERGWMIFNSISYAQKARSSLRKSFTKSDGYLLEKTEAEGVSLALLFPIPFSNVFWIRFAPLENEK